GGGARAGLAGAHGATCPVELAHDGPVDDLVADLDLDAAEDPGVDDGVDVDPAAIDGREALREAGPVVLRQRHGRRDGCRLLLATGRGRVEVAGDGAVEAATPGRGD